MEEVLSSGSKSFAHVAIGLMLSKKRGQFRRFPFSIRSVDKWLNVCDPSFHFCWLSFCRRSPSCGGYTSSKGAVDGFWKSPLGESVIFKQGSDATGRILFCWAGAEDPRL